MWKLLGGLFVGVFVGAFAVELIRRTRPELLESLEHSARTTADVLLNRFREGREPSVADEEL